jgi:hypothetical protein
VKKQVVAALLLASACASSNAARKNGPTDLGNPSPAVGLARFHPDFSKPYGLIEHCDLQAIPPTIRQEIGFVGGENPLGGRAAALVRVVSIGQPRWNTPDSRRPSQSRANAMMDYGYDGQLTPGIYTPVTLQVQRVYKGAVRSRIVAFAEGGTIGNDSVVSCSFHSARGLRIRETRFVVTVAESYLAILGNELTTGRRRGPLAAPILLNLFVARGSMAIGLGGSLEPLP